MIAQHVDAARPASPSMRANDVALVLGAPSAVVAGVLVGTGRGWLALPFTAGFAGLAAVAVLARGTRGVAAVALAALALAAGGDASWRARASAGNLLPKLAARHATARVCATVVATRERSVEVSARRVTSEGRAWSVREPLRLVRPRSAGTTSRAPVAAPGDGVCATGTLLPAGEGGPPVPALLASKVERTGTGSLPRRAASVVRERFSSAASRDLPPVHAGLLLGMTDGDTALLDEDTLESFRTTGMAHLVAVSGSNVAVVLGLVAVLGRVVVRRGRVLRMLLAVPPLVFFAFLTGLEPSVLRAVVTAGLVLSATAAGRATDGLRAAAVAFVVLVLASPELLARPGFQLSFGATVGLILWGRPLAARLTSLGEAARLPRRVAVVLGATVAVTVAAQLAVAPLLAVHFGTIPALGGVANLLVAPLAGIVMLGGMATLRAASLVPALAPAPVLLRPLLALILATARWFAALPGASVDVSALAAAALTAGLAGLCASRRTGRILALAVALVASGASCGTTAATAGSACPEAEVRALDVGQGTAILLRSRGRAVLVDGGPARGGVLRALREAGVKRLDLAVLTHPHADHSEGLVVVLRSVDVDEVVGPPTMSWGVGRELVSASRGEGVPVQTVAAGDRLDVAPGLGLDVLWPPDEPPPPEDSDEINPLNLVLRARVGPLVVLLTGDIDVRGTTGLMEMVSLEPAPVLVAPHHGSADLDPEFVSAVDPALTLVSAGRHNRYGHPTARALGIFRHHGAVARTDTDGTVVVCAVDGGMRVTSGQ